MLFRPRCSVKPDRPLAQFQCLHQRIPQRQFHASPARKQDEGMPDHYATLGLPSSATAGDIKNRPDPTALANTSPGNFTPSRKPTIQT
ncbi:hypothetical protein M8818_003019 [Zalaria obscura]|uniref:Uncharacterized protein n=1 Tax=Zalaria obscura TaxID=2024903 RepID=A0ACC3SFP7_9PEZI